MPLFTIGHGNRSVDELARMVARYSVGLIVDVRRFPGSRRNPHLSRAALTEEFPRRCLLYEWWGEALGGRRRPLAVPTRHPAWRVEAFRSYADYMDTAEVREACCALLERAAETTTAIMCAETLWWRCHRRLISDAALLRGTTPVMHLLSLGHSEAHCLGPSVRLGDDGWPVYDVGVQVPLA